MTKLSKENPFQILEDTSLTGPRSMSPEIMNYLKESLLALPVDKFKSVFVPGTQIPNKQTVSYLVSKLKSEFREKYKTMKSCDYACRAIQDMNKKYKGTSIWRIN